MSKVIMLQPHMQKNVYRARLERMDKLELLDEFSKWRDEPGIDMAQTEDWKFRGRVLLPIVYDSAETWELKTLLSQLFQGLKE